MSRSTKPRSPPPLRAALADSSHQFPSTPLCPATLLLVLKLSELSSDLGDQTHPIRQGRAPRSSPGFSMHCVCVNGLITRHALLSSRAPHHPKLLTINLCTCFVSRLPFLHWKASPLDQGPSQSCSPGASCGAGDFQGPRPFPELTSRSSSCSSQSPFAYYVCV